jgi:hypothetical protein
MTAFAAEAALQKDIIREMTERGWMLGSAEQQDGALLLFAGWHQLPESSRLTGRAIEAYRRGAISEILPY